MQSVTVLTPNARRHVVKVEPNKTILWVLEQTCTKFNFDVEEYDLKHHNKILDLSLMFRFSGVPNNATLEMVQVSTKRVEQNITICIQLEDGSRLNGDFPSSTTLKQIIEKLCPDKYESSPVVIYMRSEYHGESLINTSLRIMGLSSGGRALLRLINTDPESLKVQANVSANLPQKPREESPERSKKSAKIESSGSINVVNEIKKLKEVEKSEPMEITETTKSNEIVEKTEVKSTENIVEKMDVVESSSNNVESEEEDEQELIINYLDDRGTIIFSLDTMKSSNVEIPDSFFDLTSSEVRMLYTELKQQVDENENQPLMTAAMRQLEENKKILNQLAVYKTCTIRIQMPNRIVIQTKFKSIDKLEIVMDFLKQFLIDPNIDFHLFTTPPKTILDKNETLIELNCVPSALLHFGCDAKVDSNLIKQEFMEKLSSGSAATKILKKSKKRNENSEINDESEPSTSSSKPPVPKNFMASKATKSSTGNVPKWFKFGK